MLVQQFNGMAELLRRILFWPPLLEARLGLSDCLSFLCPLTIISRSNSVKPRKMFLISLLAGVLSITPIFKAIRASQMLNSQVLVMMFGFLDDVIEHICYRNDIRYAFSSTKNVRDCLFYIREAFEDNKKHNN